MTPMPTLTHAIAAFLMAAQADGLSQSTCQHYRSKLNRLAAHFGQQALDHISTTDLRQYIITMREQTGRYLDAPQKPPQQGGLSPETINTHIRALHRFFRWCSQEYDQPNPMSRIRYPQPLPQQPKGIKPDDIIRLLNATSDDLTGRRDRALLAFLADTGARLGGIVSLQLEALDLVRQQALVTEKGHKQRMVKFTQFTQQLLQQWLDQRPTTTTAVFTSMTTGQGLTEAGVALILKRLKKRAKITGRVNPHSFRHGFAREFILNGGDIVILSRLLGHQNINTTAAFYAIFTEDELKDLHEKFSPISHLF
jgi:integrase/recombinase XerD